MVQLIHGGDVYGDNAKMLDFSANMNPLGLPQCVQDALRESIPSWTCYPDPLNRELIQKLAQYENVPESYLHVGSGAAELLFHLALTLAPKQAVIPAPTFAEYERALQTVGCNVSFIPLYEKDGFEMTEKCLGRLDSSTDLLVLCNPNNPVGHTVDLTLMESIVKKCEGCGITLLVDECFLPFLDDPTSHTLKEKLEKYPNIIILRAFTKLYAMAGLRLGYIMCSDEKLMERFWFYEQPWNISLPAQVAGAAALGDSDYLKRTREWLKQERPFMESSLRGLGLTVYGSKANYMFFKCHQRQDLKERMAEQGILIRSCENYRGLDARFYRVAVRCREENQKLLAAMKKALGSV